MPKKPLELQEPQTHVAREPSLTLYPVTKWEIQLIALFWIQRLIGVPSVLSYSLQPHGMQHTRLSCPSLSPRVCPNSCPLSQCYHSNYLILCHLLLLLPSIFPRTRVFSNKSALHIRWPKYWNLSISLFNEYSGLISFSIDCFDLLAVQGTLKSLQHRSTQASLWFSSHIHTWLLEKP